MSLPRARLVGDVVPQQTARGSSSPLRGRSIPRELPPPGRKQSTTRGTAGKARRENETSQSSVERRAHIDIVGDTRHLSASRAPPSEEIVNALFQRLVDKLNLPPDQVAGLNLKSRDQKWQLILAQHELKAGVESTFYIQQLLRHLSPVLKEAKVKSKLLSHLSPLRKVLTDLEVDLRSTADDAWVQEFVSSPNDGHMVLLNTLKDVMDHPVLPPQKNPNKHSILARGPADLYSCLLCVKALLNHRRGFNAVMSYDASMFRLVQCMKHDNVRVKVLVLKMMLSVLLTPGGNKKVLHAFNSLHTLSNERHRWKLLVETITREPIDPPYQVAALIFINTIVQTASSLNAKVYLQHDFRLAGFDPRTVENSLSGRQDERVLHELREWRDNFVDVNAIMDDLAAASGRANSLNQELQTASASLEQERSLNERMGQQNSVLMSMNETQKAHMEEMQRSIAQLTEAVQQRDALLEENRQLASANEQYIMKTEELRRLMEGLVEENQSLKESYEVIAIKLAEMGSSATLDPHSIPITRNLSQSLMNQSLDHVPPNQSTTPTPFAPPIQSTMPPPSATPDTSAQSATLALPEPTPPPPALPPASAPPPPFPPIPPPPPPSGLGTNTLSRGARYASRIPLLMLNWRPLKDVTATVFSNLNDKRIIEVLSFTEFENLFQAKKQTRGDRTLPRQRDEEVAVLDSKRAENLIIAQRKIGQPAEMVTQYILNVDLDGLWGEHCELLLKCLPTKDELTQLSKHAHEFDRFREAEQYLFHLAKIDRYANRLALMAFISDFDHLYGTVFPQTEAVLDASLQLFKSTRLRKVFEIILAFGNYMNSGRRGVVQGFKLESLAKLSDTKCVVCNKKLTLLNYVVFVVEAIFSHTSTFYNELPSVESASAVSLQTLGTDVQELREGMKMVAEEMEKQPNNFILFSFHSNASKKVHQLIELYKRMDDVYREACLLYGEDPYPKTDESSTAQGFQNFFSYFQKFVWDWKRASDENREKLFDLFPDPNSLLRPALGLQGEDEDEGEGHGEGEGQSVLAQGTEGPMEQQGDSPLLPRARIAQHLMRTAPSAAPARLDENSREEERALESTLSTLLTSQHHSSDDALAGDEEGEERNLTVVSPDPQAGSDLEEAGGAGYISQREAGDDIIVEVNLMPLLV